MHAPFLPAFRSRLAALGRRTGHSLRQATLGQLQDQLRELLPAPLLSSEEDGPNSRERDFPLRLTFECFLWQMLKPRTACREVVRQVQALRALQSLAPLRPPLKLPTAGPATAPNAKAVPSRSWTAPRRHWPTPPPTSKNTRSPVHRNRVAVSP